MVTKANAVVHTQYKTHAHTITENKRKPSTSGISIYIKSNKLACCATSFVNTRFACKLRISLMRKCRCLVKLTFKRAKKKKTLFGDAVYKTDLSNIEQLPTTELYLLYSSIIHVNRSIYMIVNVLYYRFPYIFYRFTSHTSVPHHPC